MRSEDHQVSRPRSLPRCLLRSSALSLGLFSVFSCLTLSGDLFDSLCIHLGRQSVFFVFTS